MDHGEKLQAYKLSLLGFILAFFIVYSLNGYFYTHHNVALHDMNELESYPFQVMDINQMIRSEIKCFPVDISDAVDEERISYVDSYLSPRSYGGDRQHYGTDIMDSLDQAGTLKIVSMSDGTIENIGWLELGGYRIGVRSEENVYFYYAHLDTYENDLELGERVVAGQVLGTMGSTGYGIEGTVDQFPVHLHLGISVQYMNQDFWVNPYPFLESLKKTDGK